MFFLNQKLLFKLEENFLHIFIKNKLESLWEWEV